MTRAAERGAISWDLQVANCGVGDADSGVGIAKCKTAEFASLIALPRMKVEGARFRKRRGMS